MKNVMIYLGPNIGLASRELIITRMSRASDKKLTNFTAGNQGVDSASSRIPYYHGQLTTETYVSVTLPDNTLWQAVLQDVLSTGEKSHKDILNFHTGNLQFPGPKSKDRLAIYSMEDVSSSSSSKSSTSSQTSSSSSSSTSSQTSSSSNSSSSKSSKSSQSGSSSSSSKSSGTSSSSSSSNSSSSKSSNSSSSSSSWSSFQSVTH